MVLDEVQFLNTFKGKRVKLTLKTSSYLGVVQRINPNKTLILVDVVSGSNGFKCPGSKMFFGHEILNVEFPNEANVAIGNIHDHQFEEHLNVERFQPYKKTITFGDDEDEDEEEYINFVVIDEFQEKFGSAVMHIKKQHVIGVGADGVEVFKHGRLCWLQIATKSKVYLFDILILGARAFKNGLSMILESKHILKVIHDCRAIAGCLIAQFGVKLTNVFDTQVADVMCFYSETGGLLPDRVSTLQEVVSLHLKVPSSQLLSLQMMSQLTKEELEMWYKRPCPVPLLKVMALSVIHLQPLRLVLLDTIMTDYMALVDSYLNSSHYQPDELEHVSMESVLELPRELRQLEQTRRERQKRAADHYPLTEEGLLARFNPRSQTPSQPTLVTEEHGETQVESFEPANVESPSQVDTLLHKPPTSPPRVNNVLSVDIHASPNPQATASDLRKEMAVISPLSLGVGRGRTEVLMDTMGRGRPFEKEQSSIPALPAIGRGFLLQISQDQIPRESMGDITAGRMGVATLCPYHTHTLEVMSQPGPSVHDLPKDTSGMTEEQFRSTPKSVPSSLRQSFMSFRY
ncbi:piRNA biogenesis protein EXD1 isoform X1 [Etheostoma spectabile]|uniref:piRNA biogenesis protein EXD1 isoform X1 n=1 Tax=Etheostoma spectabile TaxID=54343 RepID=UPI0013AEC8B2|nr:piRNA biogenesis protein EXD1 isoform X1 [Etheostoma spectabile]